MIRFRRRPRTGSLYLLATIAVFLLIASTYTDVATAGDLDGVGGYSMRLKQKDFTGGEGWSGDQVMTTKDSKDLDAPSIQEASQFVEFVKPRMTFLLDWHWYLRLVSLR